jgi:hypothetical protein
LSIRHNLGKNIFLSENQYAALIFHFVSAPYFTIMALKARYGKTVPVKQFFVLQTARFAIARESGLIIPGSIYAGAA